MLPDRVKYGDGPRPLTDGEMTKWLGTPLRWGGLYTPGSTDPRGLRTYHWEPATRTVRIGLWADYPFLESLRADDRLHMSRGGEGWSWQIVASGRAVISEPTREPGDAVAQELLSMCDVRPSPRELPEYHQRLVETQALVVRMRDVRLRGELAPLDEWEEPEPMYW
ncbi:hypothetical protein [Streptomyces sclerotialus]|uniref:hypothetical protein n=1 Tax=Streptomyces sclerotialus TaxID=1957 RepID=UPI00068B4273